MKTLLTILLLTLPLFAGDTLYNNKTDRTVLIASGDTITAVLYYNYGFNWMLRRETIVFANGKKISDTTVAGRKVQLRDTIIY